MYLLYVDFKEKWELCDIDFYYIKWTLSNRKIHIKMVYSGLHSVTLRVIKDFLVNRENNQLNRPINRYKRILIWLKQQFCCYLINQMLTLNLIEITHCASLTFYTKECERFAISAYIFYIDIRVQQLHVVYNKSSLQKLNIKYS